MRVYHDFFLVPGSRSTFPDTDPTGSGSETLKNTPKLILPHKWNVGKTKDDLSIIFHSNKFLITKSNGLLYSTRNFVYLS